MERNTRQLEAVRQALAGSGRALTPPEICALAQADVASLSLATVYRRLKVLVQGGVVARVELPGQPTRYEVLAARAGRRGGGAGHHHHFLCSACDRVYPIAGCPGSMKELAPAGFRVEGHEITLHGRCASCAPAAGGR